MDTHGSKFIASFRKVLEFTCFLFVVSFVIVVTLAVIFRYVINASLPWSEEFIRFSLFWCVCLGAILVSLDDEHLRIDFIQSSLKPRAERVLKVAAHLVTLGFCFSLAYFGFELVSRSSSRSPALQLPMSWVYLAMAVGAVGIAIATFWRILLVLKEKS